MNKTKKTTFIIDFDGTLVKHEYPKIGADIGAVRVLKRLTDNGHPVIESTMRGHHKSWSVSGVNNAYRELMKDYTKRLNEAKLAAEEGAEVTVEKKLLYAPDEGSLEASVNWFITNDIPLYGIQTNPTQAGWTNSPKAYGQCIIDDICFGIPLIKNEGERPHVDWITLEKQLEEAGYFEGENNEQV